MEFDVTGLTPDFFEFATFWETCDVYVFTPDFFGFVAFCGTYPGAVITPDFFVLSLVLHVLLLLVSLTYLPLFIRVVLPRWVSLASGQVAAVLDTVVAPGLLAFVVVIPVIFQYLHRTFPILI